MNVLVIGGGGREHALSWRLKHSESVERVFCAPGNAGMQGIERVAIDVMDQDALLAFAKDNAIDLTVVGPEAPLCAGIVDRFQEAGLAIFGPSAAAAQLEGSKAFAKRCMVDWGVPTAAFETFEDAASAKQYIDDTPAARIVKVDGLAAGKGVWVCDDADQAKAAVDSAFAAGNRRLVVEEYLRGPELSVLAICDGHRAFWLDSLQDHKAVFDGNRGPNTGGMGAYAPVPQADAAVRAEIERSVLTPVLKGMRDRGTPYQGVLFAGLMLTASGPRVLEFNCRFGDPETQPAMVRVQGDLAQLLFAASRGDVRDAPVTVEQRAAVCVVIASAGYPGPYEKGEVIEGLNADGQLDGFDDLTVFHAGTAKVDDVWRTAGGRVLGVVGRGADVTAARARAYQGVAKIRWNGSHHRTDIAASTD